MAWVALSPRCSMACICSACMPRSLGFWRMLRNSLAPSVRLAESSANSSKNFVSRGISRMVATVQVRWLGFLENVEVSHAGGIIRKTPTGKHEFYAAHTRAALLQTALCARKYKTLFDLNLLRDLRTNNRFE